MLVFLREELKNNNNNNNNKNKACWVEPNAIFCAQRVKWVYVVYILVKYLPLLMAYINEFPKTLLNSLCHLAQRFLGHHIG